MDFKLNSGRFLVLRIEKSELESRFHKITNLRDEYKRNNDKQSDFRRKFQQRKEFVEKNKEELKKYWDFKKSFEEKGLWDEFVKTAKEELNRMCDKIMSGDDFESEVCSNDGEYYFDDDSIEFKIGEFTIGFYVEGEFEGDVRCWEDPGDYWTPGDSGCEIVSGEMYINSICIYIDGPESEEEFTYLPEFDKDVDLCYVDCSW